MEQKKTENSMQAYLKKTAESPKGQMKHRLVRWGGTLAICSRKQGELKQLRRLAEEWDTLEESSGMGMGFAEVRQKYEGEVDRIQKEIVQILEEKAEMDYLIDRLLPEERDLLFLRYEKGYGFDFIAMKKNMSRATCFRILDKAVQLLLEMEEDDTL